MAINGYGCKDKKQYEEKRRQFFFGYSLQKLTKLRNAYFLSLNTF